METIATKVLLLLGVLWAITCEHGPSDPEHDTSSRIYSTKHLFITVQNMIIDLTENLPCAYGHITFAEQQRYM